MNLYSLRIKINYLCIYVDLYLMSRLLRTTFTMQMTIELVEVLAYVPAPITHKWICYGVRSCGNKNNDVNNSVYERICPTKYK